MSPAKLRDLNCFAPILVLVFVLTAVAQAVASQQTLEVALLDSATPISSPDDVEFEIAGRKAQITAWKRNERAAPAPVAIIFHSDAVEKDFQREARMAVLTFTAHLASAAHPVLLVEIEQVGMELAFHTFRACISALRGYAGPKALVWVGARIDLDLSDSGRMEFPLRHDPAGLKITRGLEALLRDTLKDLLATHTSVLPIPMPERPYEVDSIKLGVDTSLRNFAGMTGGENIRSGRDIRQLGEAFKKAAALIRARSGAYYLANIALPGEQKAGKWIRFKVKSRQGPMTLAGPTGLFSE
jgi:hypothetical protein